MTTLLQNQISLLQKQCSDIPLPGTQNELYQNLYAICGDVTELNVAKDLIANEVNAI